MKRSEMVDKLTVMLLMSKNINVASSYQVNDIDLANEILNFLEKEGMKLCEKKDLGEMGILWTPIGWKPE